MAAPNIKDFTSLYGKSAESNLTTNLAVLVSNAASSNKVVKLIALTLTNIHASADATYSVGINTASDGTGTTYYFAKDQVLPNKASIELVTETTAKFLEENKSIVVSSGSASTVDAVATFSELS